MRLHSMRNGRSVTPAIGATARLFGSRKPPMRTTRMESDSEGCELYPFGSSRLPARPVQHRAREHALRDRDAVEQHHAEPARNPNGRRIACEQLREAVRERDAGATIEPPRRAIAREHRGAPERIARCLA